MTTRGCDGERENFTQAFWVGGFFFFLDRIGFRRARYSVLYIEKGERSRKAVPILGLARDL